jgi:hypothetical protein
MGGQYRKKNLLQCPHFVMEFAFEFFSTVRQKTLLNYSAADLVSVKVYNSCILYELLVKLYCWSMTFALFTFSEETIPLRDSFFAARLYDMAW